MRNLPQLLRDAERRVNAHVWPNRPDTAGRDSHLASIPANRDTDADLLLIEAATRIEKLEAALEELASGSEFGRAEHGWERVSITWVAGVARKALEFTAGKEVDG